MADDRRAMDMQMYMDQPFVCISCPKTFKSQSGLKKHMVLHTGEKAYSCTECEMTFAHKDGLKQHIAKHDLDNPKHMCALCGKRYLYRASLFRHSRLHDERKLLTCDNCGKSYNRQDTFRKHLETHLGKTECAVCKKSVLHMGDHLKICGKARAQEQTCDICLKKFKETRYLREHIRCIHDQPEQFECDRCGSKFHHRGSLFNHRSKCK